jgi:hypothetical protein
MTALLLMALTAGYDLAADLDRDGLADATEQQLLERFAPRLVLSKSECDGRPARFAAGEPEPRPVASDGTLYGQATPRRIAGRDYIELHYFHLWARDCGRNAHPLDVEHVSALLAASGEGRWEAVAWYAAAHEKTACDVSRIATAAGLRAVERGPRVWVSGGKHASFFSAEACREGCGADVCDGSEEMATGGLVNLGEPGAPLSGAVWAESRAWLLAPKMAASDFDEPLLARLAAEGAAAGTAGILLRTRQAGRTQKALRISNTTYGAVEDGGRETAQALDTAATHTDKSLTTAARKTRNALRWFFTAGRGVKQAPAGESPTTAGR